MDPRTSSWAYSSADAELVALWIVHDDEIEGILRVIVPLAPINGGAQLDQLGDFRLDGLDPALLGQPHVAPGGVQVQVDPVLAGLLLWDLLEPDRRAQALRVEQPVAEFGLITQPEAVVLPPRRLGRLWRHLRPAQRPAPEPREPGRVVRVDRQLPEHHGTTLDPGPSLALMSLPADPPHDYVSLFSTER